MTDPVLLTLTLLVVREIHAAEGGLTIIFDGDRRGLLAASLKDYHYFAELAQESLGYPVGVAFAAPGRIAELAPADNDFVAEIDDRDAEEIVVSFQGHDGRFLLRRDHREAGRIRGLLERSLREGTRLWFVARPPLLTLEEVMIIPGAGSP